MIVNPNKFQAIVVMKRNNKMKDSCSVNINQDEINAVIKTV